MDKDPKPRVVNLGVESFYTALLAQDVDCVQVEWEPPVKQDEEIENLLDMLL